MNILIVITYLRTLENIQINTRGILAGFVAICKICSVLVKTTRGLKSGMHDIGDTRIGQIVTVSDQPFIRIEFFISKDDIGL